MALLSSEELLYCRFVFVSYLMKSVTDSVIVLCITVTLQNDVYCVKCYRE